MKKKSKSESKFIIFEKNITYVLNYRENLYLCTLKGFVKKDLCQNISIK